MSLPSVGNLPAGLPKDLPVPGGGGGGLKDEIPAKIAQAAATGFAQPWNFPLSGVAAAGQPLWRLKPSIELTEYFTDNAMLTPQKRADMTTVLKPTIDLNGRSANSTLVFQSFAGVGRNTHEGANDTTVYGMSGVATTKQMDNKLDMDLRSVINPMNWQRTGTGDVFTRPIANNQSEVWNTNLNTHYADKASDQVEGSVTHQLQWSHTLSQAHPVNATQRAQLAAPANALSNGLNAALNSGSAYTKVKWSATAIANDVSYSDGRSNDTLTAEGKLAYAVTRDTDLFVKTGVDITRTANPPSTTGTGQGANNNLFTRYPSWRVGTDWAPSDRTKMSAEGGWKQNGFYWQAQLNHQTGNNLRVSLGYTQSITSTEQEQMRQLQGFVIDPATGQMVDPTTGLPVTGVTQTTATSTQFFTQRQYTFSVSRTYGRNNLIVSLALNKRKAGATNFGQSGDVSSQASATINYTRQLTHKTQGLIYLVTNKNFASTTAGQNTSLETGASFRYNISQNLLARLAMGHYALYNHLGTGYIENTISVALNKSF